MKAIWKFPIPVTDDIFELLMPKNAELLHVGMTESMAEIWLWALVDPDADKEPRQFKIYGTGHPIRPNHGTYVGTAYESGKPLVWHLFEVN